MTRRSTVALILALFGCTSANDGSATTNRSYQTEVLYLDRNGGRTGISFGSRIGIGTIEYSPGLDPLRMQEWSEPSRDCSNEALRCLTAGNFAIFMPVDQPHAGRSYQHLGRTLRVVNCDAASNTCLMEITTTPRSEGTVLYFVQGPNGILSLGFSDHSRDPQTAGGQFVLSGETGLFGSL